MPNWNTSKQNISQICHHLLNYSKPRKGGKNIWYVLNNTEFNESDLTSRKNFWKYRDEMIKMRLIKKIESIHDRGEFYSITPLGIFQIEFFDSYSIKRMFNVLEPFAKKSYLPFRSKIFGNEKIDFTNFWKQIQDSLQDEYYLIQIIERIIKDSIIDEKHLYLKLQMSALSHFEFTIVNFDFYEDRVSIDELLLDSKTKPNEVNLDQFFQYLTKLLFCIIFFSTAHEYFAEVYYEIESFSLRKVSGYEKKISFPHMSNENLAKIIYMINRVVKNRINEIYEQNEVFTKVISPMQFSTQEIRR